MKRLIEWILIIMAIVVGLDILSGWGMQSYLESHQLPGDYRMTDHSLLHTDEDIIVLGSSVGLNSINTGTIADSLGITSYNCGANGQYFPYYLTVLKAISSRYSPKKIILTLTPDNLTTGGKGTRYNFLIPYYGRGIADIDSVMKIGEPMNGLFLKSNFYRLNRIWFRIFLYHFATTGIDGSNGFVAKPVPQIFPTHVHEERTDTMLPACETQLREFIEICRDKDIDLTVIFTPNMNTTHRTAHDVIGLTQSICREYGVKFYDDSNLSPFDKDSTLFYDTRHINIEGSKIYTDTIIKRLKL